MKKSKMTAFLLNLFFASLGLFYSSTAAGIVFTLAAIGLAYFTSGIGVIPIWLISIFVGQSLVTKHNNIIDISEKRHQEIVEATKSK